MMMPIDMANIAIFIFALIVSPQDGHVIGYHPAGAALQVGHTGRLLAASKKPLAPDRNPGLISVRPAMPRCALDIESRPPSFY